MGDSDVPVTETLPGRTDDSQRSDIYDTPKSSIDILKEATPSPNIAITDLVDQIASMPAVVVKASVTDDDTTQKCEQKITVQELRNDAAVEESIKSGIEREVLKSNEKKSSKLKSDIFGVSTDNITSTIFSIGGAPSKTIHQDVISNDISGSNAWRQNQHRNPLTGIGVSSKDEFKNKPSKRKDGNPLLGVGYKDDETFLNPAQSQRIPPGGYSKGLW